MKLLFASAVVSLSVLFAGCGGAEPNNSGGFCSAAAECVSFACGCNDGTFFNTARFCSNGSCQNAASTCNNACNTHGGGVPGGQFPSGGGGGSNNTGGGGGFGSGGGSGSGGGFSGGTCSDAADCPAYACDCSDGSHWDSARYCLNHVCQGGTATCNNACR